ncbi:MAG: glycosyltransferase family 4 protein [bacterium]|nr:glycosyltransferase family 4 protein [bacterium]
MKILIISPFFPYPLDSGGKTRVFNIIEGLRKEHQITLISLIGAKEGHHFQKLKNIWPNVAINIVSYQEDLNYSNRYLRKLVYLFQILNPFYYESIYSNELSIVIQKTLGKNNFDLIQVEFSQLAHFLPEDISIPSIIVAHDLAHITHHRRFLTALNLIEKWKEFKNWLNFKKQEQYWFPKYTKCIVMSENDRLELLKSLPSLNITVLPNGVDTNFYTKINNDENIKITFLGGLSHPPNLTALKYFTKSIYPLIINNIKNLNFFILGNPGEINIDQFKVDSNVQYLGFVKDSRPYLSNSIFVAPLLSGSGTRLKILEAMSLECAVVATTIACEGIDVTNHKNVIIADEPKDFAKAVFHLIINKEMRQDIGKNARQLVIEKYDWNVVIKKYHCMLQKLIL